MCVSPPGGRGRSSATGGLSRSLPSPGVQGSDEFQRPGRLGAQELGLCGLRVAHVATSPRRVLGQVGRSTGSLLPYPLNGAKTPTQRGQHD